MPNVPQVLKVVITQDTTQRHFNVNYDQRELIISITSQLFLRYRELILQEQAIIQLAYLAGSRYSYCARPIVVEVSQLVRQPAK